ncbi:MAG: FAD-binding protein [Pseudomonadota bacterium]|nr:FAD-binding protein [Pseudomonadota bacterium]
MPPKNAPFPKEAAQALAEELRRRIAGEVRFDAGSRALYATDASNYRQVPIGVVIPRDVDDVIETVAVCRGHDAPVLARGGGTSLAGQCCNVAVVMDFSKHLRRILELDPQGRRARVEPGCVLDELRDAAEGHHLTFGPDPSTHDHNCLGGMIGNNSCGVHSLMAGRTADNVNRLEILTYDGLRMWVGPTSEDELARIIGEGGRRGEIYAGLKAIRDQYAPLIREKFPHIPRRVSGYNLDELLPENGFHVARALTGSESTCVTVLQADLRLVPSPPHRVLLVLGYPDVYAAGDHVPRLLDHAPIGLEGIDDVLIDYMKDKHMHPQELDLLPEGRGWLLVEFGGDDREEAQDNARRLMRALQQDASPPAMKLFDDPDQQHRVWAIRESGLGATARIQGGPYNWEGWEDAAVPPARVGPYLRDFRQLLERFGYGCSLYGHFGDGCIHVRIDFDLASRAGIDKFKAFTDAAADLVLRYGGSLSGEHGDGQARADLLPKMFGDELMTAFRRFKALWDPQNKMNPGKVVDPYPRDSNLRLSDLARVDTVFAYREEENRGFAGATLRCVGVGNCRHINKGVMCPSYMATREEMHSTRGRARLLHEMVYGMTHDDAPITDGWKSRAVYEALELCLACKGCLSDCPVDVDMATYKAEFNHHYFKGRLRPRVAYAMGLIWWWSRAASLAPWLANFFTQTPGLDALAKRLAGVHPDRRLPRFARRTFKQWFDARQPGNPGGRKVLLWPDTFNNFLRPEILAAAVEVLEAAGFQVQVPRPALCCARPLYAWGMLDAAKRLLRDILEELGPESFNGIPIVGVEPACVAAFRDELVKLFPDDPRAQRLSKNTFMLGEFLARQEGYAPPPLHRRAVVHAHCNHHAVIGVQGERKIMDAMGLDYALLDSGCCGMAGPFGFEADHYALSLRIGERVLLPAVRRADQETLIVTDGYACGEQIAQTTDRRALHLAQVLQMALRQGPRGPRQDYPERAAPGL